MTQSDSYKAPAPAQVSALQTQTFQSQTRRWLAYAAFAMIVCLMSVAAINNAIAAEPVSKSKRGVMIGGHDTVAYHTLLRDPQAKAAAGKKTFVVEYLGAKWRFASQENADLFKANPGKYKPAYNGHCANALSLGKGLLKTNGKVWEIFDDQLYLFYAKKGRKRWLSVDDISDFKAVADAEWAKLSQ